MKQKLKESLINAAIIIMFAVLVGLLHLLQ